MYVPFQDATFLPINIAAPPLTAESGQFPAFSVSAAKGQDGQIHIAVANADTDHGYHLALDLGTPGLRHVAGQMLSAARLDAQITPG